METDVGWIDLPPPDVKRTIPWYEVRKTRSLSATRRAAPKGDSPCAMSLLRVRLPGRRSTGGQQAARPAEAEVAVDRERGRPSQRSYSLRTCSESNLTGECSRLCVRGGSRLSRPPRRPDRWPSGAARRPVGGGPGISLKCSVFCADTEFEAHRRELPNSMCPTRSCALFAFTLG